MVIPARSSGCEKWALSSEGPDRKRTDYVRIAADRDAEFDADAIVLVADRAVHPEAVGAVLGTHGIVENEAACGKHDALVRADETVLIVDPYDHADGTVALGDQCHGAGIDVNFGAEVAGAGFQDIDERTSAPPAHVLDDVTTRGGLGVRVERCGSLAARPDQRGVIGRFDYFAGKVIAAIGHALILEPLVVRQCLAAIAFALGIVGAGATGKFQVGSEVLDRVVESCCLLCIGAAADVDLATRQSRCAAAARAAFEQRDARTRRARFYGGAGPGRAEADDRHIRLKIPLRHLRRR